VETHRLFCAHTEAEVAQVAVALRQPFHVLVAVETPQQAEETQVVRVLQARLAPLALLALLVTREPLRQDCAKHSVGALVVMGALLEMLVTEAPVVLVGVVEMVACAKQVAALAHITHPLEVLVGLLVVVLVA
jgi:hypothetical protein